MSMEIYSIGLNAKDYPVNLKSISGRPDKLYVRGKILGSDEKAVAIVGSRLMSKSGEEKAYEFSFVLAKLGYTIISGLAQGIDGVAHMGALDAGGRTIAVLGTSIDKIYPAENRALAQRVIRNGALVSEYAPGVTTFKQNFLHRNRIISGLAKCVLVVEGGRRSGTLSTAGWAADQGRGVFVIPGSEITKYLAYNGATIANGPVDIIEYLNNQ